MRRAAGGLLSTRLVKRAETRQLLALVAQFSSLADTLARLREAQGRASQARAARAAAECAEAARRTPATTATTFASTRTAGPVTGPPGTPHRAGSGHTPRPSSTSR